MKTWLMTLMMFGVLSGALEAEDSPRKFERFFVFGAGRSDELAEKAKECGVTDSSVRVDAEQLARLKKHGIRAYIGFGPRGPHRQVMTPEETERAGYLSGRDLRDQGLSREERAEALEKRRREARYQWGGEPLPDSGVEVHFEVTSCFIGEAGRDAGRKSIDESVAKLEEIADKSDVAGFVFDYIGYSNYKGCYHPDCLVLLDEYLKDNKLEDNETNRNAFYLNELVAYNNAVVDHIKSIRPEWKVASHIYPVFMPEPLYGNRLKVDYCGQTVAWFFVWPEEKVRRYAEVTVKEQNRYFDDVKGVPFVAFGRPPRFDLKTPEIFDRELNAILDSGADYLMLHMIRDVVEEPDVFEILKKYCAPGE